MEICKICNKEFKNIIGLGNHIKIHSILKEEYYNLYINNNLDNKCINCNKSTKFETLFLGYNKFCCKNCYYEYNNLTKPKRFHTQETKEKIKKSLNSIETKEKIKKANLEKYGVESTLASKIIREKSKQTMLEKYGVDNCAKIESVKKQIKETSIKNGYQVCDEDKAQFLLYRRNVDFLSKKNRKILFENWDGYDFYDNEYIKDNFKLKPGDRNYPTVDHKISILQGFLNKIPFEIIGSIDNLCITKKHINSSKYSKGKSIEYKN